MRTRGLSLVGVLVATLAPTSAFAADPPAPPAIAAAPAVAKAGPAKPAAAEPLPEPSVRFSVVETAPQGPWTMQIDNEGAKPVRVPADVRLLRFEIEPEPYVAPTEAESAKPKKWAPPKKPAKAIQCKIPAPLRPEGFPESSSLLLRPGESYVESFDPRLFCFGKEAAARLAGGAVVHVRFGWEAAKKPAWSATKKPDGGPFAVEGTAFPPEVLPLRELTAPTMVLRYSTAPKPPPPDSSSAEATAAAEPSEPETKAPPPSATDPKAPAPTAAAPGATDPKAPAPSAAPEVVDPNAPKVTAPGLVMLPSEPAPAAVGAKSAPQELAVVDENAPRLELTASPFVEASSTSRAAVTLTATNVGHRPMLIALNPRMLGFRVDGPDGVLRCSPMPPTHGIPRERFTTLKPGGSSSMTLLLSEGCTRDALRRPGLYRIQATLLAGESGSELGLTAYTGKVRARDAALVRVLDGPDPFYAVAPRAIPTPKPPAPEGDESDE